MAENNERLKNSEQLLEDLYLNLRQKLLKWAHITSQTPQARMGYVGQHLTSIVTGYSGGKSGARGRDIIINDYEFGEIKTCYRIDQVGICFNCKAKVASFELKCNLCNSSKIDRKDDSKWLITIKDEKELKETFDPKIYYLVLFEFVDFNNPKDINASIYTLNPFAPGFSLCMIDYFFNIKSKSQSGAPFNFWPHSFKFHLMDTQLIYRSQLKFNNKIITSIFPMINQPLKDNIELSNFTKSRNFSQDSINEMLDYLKIKHSTKDKKKNILILQSFFEKSKFDNELITTFLSYIIYKNVLENNKEFVPKKTMEILNFNLKKIQSFSKDLQKN
tara:strand:+ start:91 stop:1086 length:996 start_codon:yes stop_codon:yes gene_type:complete